MEAKFNLFWYLNWIEISLWNHATLEVFLYAVMNSYFTLEVYWFAALIKKKGIDSELGNKGYKNNVKT